VRDLATHAFGFGLVRVRVRVREYALATSVASQEADFRLLDLARLNELRVDIRAEKTG
jgi:hypothetical protein